MKGAITIQNSKFKIQNSALGWRQFGKLLMRWASNKLEIKCPRCSLNIKVDKKEIESIIDR